MRMDKLIEQLVIHEGKRNFPYKCTAGKTTIGVGRNLDDVGISDEEMRFMLSNDINRVVAELDKAMPWWVDLDEVRQRVLVDMCFNLGLSRLTKFKKTLSYIQNGDYEKASVEMLDSAWARQVGRRANTLSDMMRTGEG